MQIKVFGELFFTHIILKNPKALKVLKMCLQEKTFLKAERESTAILILVELNFPRWGWGTGLSDIKSQGDMQLTQVSWQSYGDIAEDSNWPLVGCMPVITPRHFQHFQEKPMHALESENPFVCWQQ